MQSVVRVGSCGALAEKVGVRDVVIASGACTDSAMNRLRFHGLDYAPVADFGLLRAAYDAAQARDDVTVCTRADLLRRRVLHAAARADGADGRRTACWRWRWRPARSTRWPRSTAARRWRSAPCRDHIVTGEETTAQEREQTFAPMVEIALEASLGS